MEGSGDLNDVFFLASIFGVRRATPSLLRVWLWCTCLTMVCSVRTTVHTLTPLPSLAFLIASDSVCVGTLHIVVGDGKFVLPKHRSEIVDVGWRRSIGCWACG